MDRIIEQKNRWKRKYLLYGLGGVALVALLIWGFAGSGSNVQRATATLLQSQARQLQSRPTFLYKDKLVNYYKGEALWTE